MQATLSAHSAHSAHSTRPCHVLAGTLNDHPGLPFEQPADADHFVCPPRNRPDDQIYMLKREWKRRWHNPAWHELPPEIREHYEGLPSCQVAQVCSVRRLGLDELPPAIQSAGNTEVIAVHRVGFRAPEFWALRHREGGSWTDKAYKRITTCK